ncbi:hypothetical protein ACLOJK_034962 [Asimina triloba]
MERLDMRAFNEMRPPAFHGERDYRVYYIPDSEWTRRAAEFMHLVQGKMSVEEYDIEFRSLTDRRETARKFREGLGLSIRRGLAPLKTFEYGDILDRARMIKREEEEQDRIREKRKGAQVGGQNKKQKVGTDRAAPVKKGACYQCGQFGHRKFECPQLWGQIADRLQGQVQVQKRAYETHNFNYVLV